VYLPREVEIRQGGRTLELTFRRYTVNEGLDEGSFRRGIPETAE
jgi:outer membrane lipoprotein-sorting protein